jgi:hypothetical protein
MFQAQRNQSSSRFPRAAAKRSLCALALLVGASCSRSNAFHRQEASAAARQQLPFHEKVGSSSEQRTPPERFPASAATRSFTIPEGTLLTVCLEDHFVLSRARSGDLFSASVVQPLIIGGERFVREGDRVTGKVEFSQSPKPASGRSLATGYVRLTLTTITVDNRELSLRTSSLFARTSMFPVSFRSNSPVEKNFPRTESRILTFRLSAPLAVTAPLALASR